MTWDRALVPLSLEWVATQSHQASWESVAGRPQPWLHGATSSAGSFPSLAAIGGLFPFLAGKGDCRCLAPGFIPSASLGCCCLEYFTIILQTHRQLPATFLALLNLYTSLFWGSGDLLKSEWLGKIPQTVPVWWPMYYLLIYFPFLLTLFV